MVDAVNRAEVVRGVAATVVKGQEGRIFEREHGEGRHQDFIQSEFNLARPQVGNRAEQRVEKSNSTVSRKKYGGTRFVDDVYDYCRCWRLGALSASDQRADAAGSLKNAGFTRRRWRKSSF